VVWHTPVIAAIWEAETGGLHFEDSLGSRDPISLGSFCFVLFFDGPGI
jgi:hypothetical protein